ncbi:MAG TPA: ABC transporter ATP-binding protein [Propionicimonas sp.]
MEVTRVVLRADRIYRFFHPGDEEILALKGVSLHVAQGEIVAVMGPSGCGKSTLLACLAGLDDPQGGTVSVAGERLSHRPERIRARIRGERIGVLNQNGNLLAHLTVRQNITLAQNAVRSGKRAELGELLDALGLATRAHALPSELSGGELARAGLGVALANTPDLILADEPTGELDGATEQEVLKLLRARARMGAALLIVTHSVEVSAVADRVIHLSDGEVAA